MNQIKDEVNERSTYTVVYSRFMFFWLMVLLLVTR